MFLFILGIFLLILAVFMEKFRLGQVLNFIITYLIIIGVVSFVEYTPDRVFYIYWIHNIPEKLEPFFKITANFIVKNGYDYHELHLFFTFTYTFLLLFLISRFSTKLYIISLLYIVTIFIFYVTQLRYFMGYYAVCLGLYYLYVKRNLFWAIILLVFGVSNHYGLFLFGVIVLFFYIKPNKLLSSLLIGTIGVVLFTLFIVILGSTIFSQIRFIGYFVSELQSSLLGGLLTFFPYLIIVFAIQKLHQNNIKIRRNIVQDKKYMYLYIMSVANIIFIGEALITQVIGHRMIMTATLFQIMFVFYSVSFYDNRKKNILIIKFLFSFLALFCYMYFFSELVAGSGSNDDIMEILKSNKLLNYFIL